MQAVNLGISHHRLKDEILDLISSSHSLLLSTLGPDNEPYSSDVPFVMGKQCLYLQLPEQNLHVNQLEACPHASIYISEIEKTSHEISEHPQPKRLANRQSVTYHIISRVISCFSAEWQEVMSLWHSRYTGRAFSSHRNARLYCLHPLGGYYVKGFGRSYHLIEGSLNRQIPSVEHEHLIRNKQSI